MSASSSRSGLRIWIVVFAVVFVALAVRIVLYLTADFLPARWIDVDRSHFVRIDAERAELTLVVKQALTTDETSCVVKPPTRAGAPYVVEVQARARKPDARAADQTQTFKIAMPAADRVRVLDLRWEHPGEHPQGHEFELLDAPPSGSADS